MDYYFIKDDVQIGPLDINQLFDYKITPETKIWHEGLDDWIPLRNDPVLWQYYESRFRQTATPPPNGSYSYPPQPPYTYADVQQVKSYIPWSILNIVLCGFVVGCVALVFSIMCENAKARGEMREAERYSKIAKNINLWTFIIVGGLLAIYVIVAIIFGITLALSA